MSNRLDPDQAQHFVGPGLGPNCLKDYQQTTLGGIELNKKLSVKLRIFSLTLVLGPQKNHLNEMVLLSTHNICCG